MAGSVPQLTPSHARGPNRRAFLGVSLAALLMPQVSRAQGFLRRRPYVQNVGRTRATICWTTEADGAAQLMVRGPQGSPWTLDSAPQAPLNDIVGLAPGIREQRAVAEGLEPGVTYSYSVLFDGVEDIASAGQFRTAGASAYTFLAIGDTGTGSAEQEQLARALAVETAALLIHTGDLAYPTGQLEAYERHYFDYYHALMRTVPFFPCPGNHDYYETQAQPYLHVHDLPTESVPPQDHGRYYSFDWGDVHFISLDSNEPLTAAVEGRGEMLQWLERDLAACSKFWRIVYFHHPPYAFGPNSADAESARVRSHVVPILQRYGVPLVLSGHEHSYQRTNAAEGAVYLTTGGGGAPLYPVYSSPMLAAGASCHHYLRLTMSGDRLSLRAVDAGGRVFDEASIAPPPVLADDGVVCAASLGARIGAGSVVSIRGWQLALETLDNGGKPLQPGRASGTRVMTQGKELPLLFVSPTQINVVLPQGLTGIAELLVLTPNGTVSREIEIMPVAPALVPLVLNADGSPNGAESPCRAGSRVVLLANGLAEWRGAVRVRMGQADWLVQTVAAAMPGLRMIEIALPAGLSAGMYPVRMEAAGIVSNSVEVAVG